MLIDAFGSVVAEKTLAPDRASEGLAELLPPTNDDFAQAALAGIGVTAVDGRPGVTPP